MHQEMTELVCVQNVFWGVVANPDGQHTVLTTVCSGSAVCGYTIVIKVILRECLSPIFEFYALAKIVLIIMIFLE